MNRKKAKGQGAKREGRQGGMGGPRGGDLHETGSAQAGMTGGSGMGGNEPVRRADQLRDQGGLQDGSEGSRAQSRSTGEPQGFDMPQNEQREGLGSSQQSKRMDEEEEVPLDATRDVDDIGSHHSATARERDERDRR